MFLPSAVWSIGTTSLALSVGLVTVIAAGVWAETAAAVNAPSAKTHETMSNSHLLSVFKAARP